MKKIIITILIGMFLIAPMVEASTSIVGTSTDSVAFGATVRRNSFFANGRHWIFWFDGTNEVFSSSVNGTEWNASTTAVTDVTEFNEFALWFDGTYIHYAFSTYVADTDIFYRRGVPESDGTITWSADQQTVFNASGGDKVGDPSIAVDTNGRPWIAYKHYDGSDTYPYVTSASTSDGTWETTPGFPDQLSGTSNEGWHSSIIPLTDGKMYVVSSYINGRAYGALWNNGWNMEYITGEYDLLEKGDYFSIVADGDDVHFVFERNGDDFYYQKRTYGVGWSEQLKIEDFVYGETPAPTMSIDNDNSIYVFWLYVAGNSGDKEDHIFYRKRDSDGNWDDAVDFIDATDSAPVGWIRIASDYNEADDKIKFFYQDTETPYNIKTDFIDLSEEGTSTSTPTSTIAISGGRNVLKGGKIIIK